MYKKYIKNILDVLIGWVAIILCFPIMVIIAIAIKMDSKGPVFFKQARTGKNGKTFYMYKFRTMEADNDAHNFEEENRYTKVGKLLQRSSLDELGQLMNIRKTVRCLLLDRELG